MQKNIVILHGWGATAGKLGSLSKELKKLGWNTLLTDLPGFGSEKLEKPYKLKDYAKFVATKTNRYFKGKEFIIFGHSNGGRVAIGVNKYYPKNLRGLVLCAAGGISRPILLKRLIFLVLAKTGKVLLFVPPLARFFKKILYKAAREHDYKDLNGYLKITFRNLTKENLKKFIPKINMPTLILWGTKDKMTPFRDAKYLKRKIKNSKLVTYETGHKLPYIKPKELAAEIELWYRDRNFI